MCEAFHAPEFEALDLARLETIAPEAWERARLCPNPSLRLIASPYPVNRYLQAVFDEREPAIPARSTSRVAVYRKDYRVWRLGLGREAFATLRALCDGEPFAAALAHAGRAHGEVGTWFQAWAAEGLFSDVTLPDAASATGERT
jgi:hypothetical protein